MAKHIGYAARHLTTILWFSGIFLNLNATGERITRFQKASKAQTKLSDAWLREHINDGFQHNMLPQSCPCPNPDDCQPISSSNQPFRKSGEVFGFADRASTGEQYNWTHISTVAWADNNQLMCQAHKHGSRAVVATPSFNLTYMATLGKIELGHYIEEWVERAISMVVQRYRDGVVFDFEGPLKAESGEGQAYVALINATRQTFHSNLHYPLQVTTCVAWSPDGIDGRNYPYKELAQVSDLLYVMDYDTQSQIIQGPCTANANAPYSGMKQGIERYLSLDIAPKKLILGVPWYGYKYPCLKGTEADDRYCPIQEVPFRGVNCSDAAGREVPYSVLLREYYNQSKSEIEATGGLKRESYMDSSFFNQLGADGLIYQSWMDDPISLRHKYSYAKLVGMGGVGPFTFDDLDSLSQPNETAVMWKTFEAYMDIESAVGGVRVEASFH